MYCQVTIVDRDERDEQNLITRRALALRPPSGQVSTHDVHVTY